jgi:16S rRNA (cytosine1402-N4)-methyltransferase
MQLDRGEKGFSFLKEGPLDMRMDPREALTAREIVNHWTEKQLGDLLRTYGEEPKWRRLARAIVAARRTRSLETTTELAEVIASACGGRGKLHPATLVFQALRIRVNRELEVLQEALAKAAQRLAPEGRIGVISFHRLEDRIVKHAFRESQMLEAVTKKPLQPTLQEIRDNRRARSAKLRFAERRHV